ncbi:MAG: DNA-binding protein [Pseudomonadota bacterium]
MTLQNLLGISLDAITPNRETVARLLAAAERNLADAALPALSAENRFDAAYKAIMQCAMVALHANGYRTLTSRPGHHQSAIQTLPQTLNLATDQMIVLDALRKQRNLADYDGDPIPDAAVSECIASARALLAHVKKWLGINRPDLL